MALGLSSGLGGPGTSTLASAHVGAVVRLPAGVVFDGDSRVQQLGVLDWYNWVLRFGVTTGVGTTKVARSGQTLATMDATFATNTLPAIGPTRNAVFLSAGINDLLQDQSGAVTDLTLRASLLSYAAKVRAAGARFYWGTVPSTTFSSSGPPVQNMSPQKNAYLAAFNAWARSNWPSFADGLADIAARTEMADPDNTYFFPDKLHPGAAGCWAYEDEARKAMGFPPGSDLTPNAFPAIAPVTGAAGGSVYSASADYVIDTTAPAPISITGGEYRLNGGAWTAAAGLATPRSLIEVRGTASTTAGATINVVLSVGSATATLSITTAAALPAFVAPAVAGDAEFGNGGRTISTTAASTNVRMDRALGGKKAWAITADAIGGTWWCCGVSDGAPTANGTGFDNHSLALLNNGGVWQAGFVASIMTAIAQGETIGVLYDAGAKKIWFTRNGVNFYGASSAGTNAAGVAAGTQGQVLGAWATGAVYPACGSSDSAGKGFTSVAYPWTLPSGFAQL